MAIFMVLFSVVVYFLVDFQTFSRGGFSCYATCAFLLGSVISILCGYIGMKIAVNSNSRTTYKAITSIEEAFQVAF